MANNRIYVSPGVYTKETDLSYASAVLGVTTLGIAGETLKGPAFEPIAISNQTMFKKRFGGQSSVLFSNGVPKYELPYIANAYLEQSNQLYVTRILGLSGYEAGKAWTITTIGSIDPDTINVVETTGTTTFIGSATTFSDSTIQGLVDKFDNLPITNLSSGSTFTVSSGSTLAFNTGTFTASEVDLTVLTFSGNTNGTASYILRTITGSPLTAFDNLPVGMIRSRASYENEELTFKASAVTSNGGAVSDALGNFNLVTPKNTYVVSLDERKGSFIKNVIGVSSSDNKADIFAENIYSKILTRLVNEGKVFGLNSSLGNENNLYDYKKQFDTPITPFIVSELRGNVVEQLFRFISISDGNDANKEIKISIENINFDTREFDVVIRSFDDLDSVQTPLEAFRRCSMNPSLNNYIARRIGTTDGLYESYSTYLMIEMAENAPNDAIPAGFEGYHVANYSTSKLPLMNYKTTYDFTKDKVRKAYLGISDIVGIDQNMFNFIGNNISTGTTKGFHLDMNVDASLFDKGNASFLSTSDVAGSDYENINARKFTLCPAGGFDGWDIYRTNRTNTDDFRENQPKFSGFTKSLPSDYYAYLKGIRTFNNPSDIDINLFATPGIDYDRQNALVKETIEMIEEERKDSLYIITTPDQPNEPTSPDDSVDLLDAADIDSSYSATHAPWVKHNDTQNNVNIYLPPTFEFLRDAAEVDKKKAPWFSIAGVNNGKLKSKNVKYKVNDPDSDTFYAGRINPIRKFSGQPLVIWGQKTLQVADSALNRINVRRLLLQTRKLVSIAALQLVFEPNDVELQDQFKRLIDPILADIKKQRGLTNFEIVCDSSNNSNADRDQLQLNGYIRIKPTLAVEYIVLEFGVTDQGATFGEPTVETE